MSARVLFAEPCRYDTSQAKEFGDVVYLFPVEGDRPGIFDPLLLLAIRRKLETLRFDASSDWVVAAGSVVLVSHLLAVVAVDHGEVNLLLFDAETREYRPRSIERLEDARES